MDWDMQKTSVVIVGAGFSAAASDGKMPLMTGFFDQLKKDHFPQLFEFVSEVVLLMPLSSDCAGECGKRSNVT